MKSEVKKHGTGCLVAQGVDIFGDRWSLLIIRDMLLYGKKTYGEFLGAGECISTNILAVRLKHLEAEGIIEKRRDPENGRSYVYNLTDKGLALAPVVFEIIRWSGTHVAASDVKRTILRRIEEDSEGLLAEITERVKSQTG